MADGKHTAAMAETTEKNDIASTEQLEDVHVVKKVHADGTVDLVDAHAIGGDLEEMPPGYFWSLQFIGTVTVRLSHQEDHIHSVIHNTSPIDAR